MHVSKADLEPTLIGDYEATVARHLGVVGG